MQIFHHSREPRYRSPYGARPCGTTVHLAVNVKAPGEIIEEVALCYRYGLYTFAGSTVLLNAHPERPNDYGTDLRLPGNPALLFYWFHIKLEDRKSLWYVPHPRGDGTGCVVRKDPAELDPKKMADHCFRITVYDRDYRTPDWVCGNVMYQIFPDRFRRDEGWTPTRMREARPLSERIYHDDWSEDVDYVGKPETGYMACDFFGGSLNGIREKLDYLQDLGIGILYLNPIFHARSNHRYDTGDYLRVDPMLGTNEDFRRLCREARQRGIRIILDGVFSHTGADSIYFNKYNRFPSGEVGAYQQLMGRGRSPYYSWYDFHREGEKLFYSSWWGFEDLPAVKEEDLTYRDFILGEHGVVRHWLRMGASGFRLDVSDELPDDFLRDLYRTVKDEDPEAFVMGEVWEDATTKISYGSYRDFLFGRTHDAVMGYPFQEAVTGFFAGTLDADEMDRALETIREQYPPPAFASNMSLLSSHDIPRFITAVAGADDPGTRAEQAKLTLSAKARQQGEKKLALAYLLALTYPGCPSLYYGDEIAMEGYRDPFNRRTFDWSKAGGDLSQMIADLAGLRARHPVLQTGHYRTVLAEGRHFVYMRYLEKGKDLLGRSRSGPATAYVMMNAGETPWKPMIVADVGVLEPYSAVILMNGDSYYFSYRPESGPMPPVS